MAADPAREPFELQSVGTRLPATVVEIAPFGEPSRHPVLWRTFRRFPSAMEAHIVAGRLEAEGVPVILVAAGVDFSGEQPTELWVPAVQMHRAAWLLAWPPIPDDELILLATSIRTP